MNFLGIEEKYSNLKQAQSVILPIPYEQTTSYISGTKYGPKGIIDASAYVELYDEELDAEVYKKGIYTAPELNFSGQVEQDFQLITDSVSDYLKKDKFVISLGGEHSITFPVFRAFNEQVPNLSILQLDAHSDLRDSYEGSIFSHASVMSRIFEINPNIVQLGIRSQCIEEAKFIKEKNIQTHYAHELRADGFNSKILNTLSENVYLTIDVDYFDPSVMPATGTPEPGGFLWYETLGFLKQLFKMNNVVGMDIVELSPIKDMVHPDFFAAKLIYKLLGYKFL